jgi:hypothetical protein
MSISLPGQCQSPRLDSTAGIVVSQGAKFDEFIRITIRHRKHLLQPVIEPLGKRCQVLGGVEFGILQLLWPRLSDLLVSVDEMVDAPLTISVALTVTSSPPWTKPEMNVIERENLAL